MKNKFKIIFFAAFLFCNNMNAQEWAPVGAKWYYDFNITPSIGYVKIEYIKDTIINSNTCKVLKKIRFSYDYPGVYNTVSLGNEYIFQNGSKVYNYKYGQFYLLYDFFANTNDIWTIAATNRDSQSGCDTIGKVKVDSTNIIIIKNDTFKIIYTSSYQNSDWVYTGPIVEKLGCIGYMLPEPYLCYIDHNEGGNLRCYSDSFYAYQKDSLLPCDFINSIDETIIDDHFLKIYPNPTNNILNISTTLQDGNTIELIEIYNCFGQLIKKTDINNSYKKFNHIINIQSLSSGIYLMRIKTNYNYFEKKIIKN
ncbi:MAG TPA: T9SS type A sorting domain-containing protein [Bacteroidales bacterium]|nr:T9SS type A sorting domain-containing protein [Bacteroidales bacterium]HPS17558.1 T9SS type A sorting domain-containing protein [Bacteroidales bacterium]